jgi:Tol biopolymer transport system component
MRQFVSRRWVWLNPLVLSVLTVGCGEDHGAAQGPRDAAADHSLDAPPGDAVAPLDTSPPDADAGQAVAPVDTSAPDTMADEAGPDAMAAADVMTGPDTAPAPDVTPAPEVPVMDAVDAANPDPACASGGRRANTSASGEQGQGEASVPAVSGDGRYVAFSSVASNLVPNDLNGRGDVFVKDMHTGAIERVSVSSLGAEGNGDSGEFSAGERIVMTPDARYVAFSSAATNLVSGDTNNNADVFLRDRQAGTTIRISVTSMGAQVAGDSRAPTISADGQRIAFSSSARGYDNRDTNDDVDIYVHDRTSGLTRLLSVAAGQAAVGAVPAISADGHKVVFQSSSGLYVPVAPGPSPAPVNHIYLADVDTGSVSVVSVSATGALGNGTSTLPAINADGGIVAFDSYATNLVDGDSNGVADVFVRDTVASTTTRISLRADGTQAAGNSVSAGLDATGNRVVFQSRNLEGGSSSGADVYVRDRALGTTFLVSRGLNGFAESRVGIDRPLLTGNGRLAVYTSSATNVVPGDTNGAKDVFLSAVGCP